MFIKQYSIKTSSKASVSLDYKPVIMSIWQLINSVYKSEQEQFSINDEQSFSFNKKMIIQYFLKSKPAVLEKTSESTSKTLITNLLLLVSALLSKTVLSFYVLQTVILFSDINVNFISKKVPKLYNTKKSYVQASKANISPNIKDVLHIKEACPALLADEVTRIIKVKNSGKEQKKPKINIMIKGPSRKQIIIIFSFLKSTIYYMECSGSLCLQEIIYGVSTLTLLIQFPNMKDYLGIELIT